MNLSVAEQKAVQHNALWLRGFNTEVLRFSKVSLEAPAARFEALATVLHACVMSAAARLLRVLLPS